jgi:hypothetical protein
LDLRGRKGQEAGEDCIMSCFTKYYGDQIKDDEKCIQYFWLGNLKGRDYLEDRCRWGLREIGWKGVD